jgi:uncharacterized protein YkwD
MGKAKRALAGALVIATAAACFSVGAASGATRLQTRVLNATNRSRVHHDLRALPLQRRLSRQATRHTRAMARHGYLYHTRNIDLYLHGITWHLWGENIGYTTGSVAHLESMFMHSPEHRANILTRGFRHVAVGAIRRNGKLWVTVFFYG